MKNSSNYILGFPEIDRTMRAIVGGKGANLGELTRIAGIDVPPGFCITTTAYSELTANNAALHALLDQLALLAPTDQQAIRATSNELRNVIEAIAIPAHIEEAITQQLEQLGADGAYAIRSSATAEDLPTASFAGQQDSYLNVIGKAAILAHIRKCWASLFTERAVSYRLLNGFDHRQTGSYEMAIVVQQMVFPEVAGIAFTADPVTANRKVLVIDASFGLGESLVAGLVNADQYTIRDGKLLQKQVSTKKRAVHALREGGTEEREITPSQQQQQALTDEQISTLEGIARKIEAHFGTPQDIEWCLAGDTIFVVQSRPITTLFPVPETPDTDNHVYVSVGHQQMMTDALKPLGVSFFQLTALRPMHTAGGRLFIDVAQNLASPVTREVVLDALGKSDPLITDALQTIIERGDFLPQPPEPAQQPAKSGSVMALAASVETIESQPEIVAALIEQSGTAIATLKAAIQKKTGPELLDFILEDLQRLKQFLFDTNSIGVIKAAIDASFWITEKMAEWLGGREDLKKAADTLAQSVPNNITSEMGLALLRVADVLRPLPEVVAYLQQETPEHFPEALLQLEGGREAYDAIRAYLDRYGMRCAGEIDITKTRWSEQPAILIPLLLTNIRNFEPGAAERKFEQGLQEARAMEAQLMEALHALPDGEEKAAAMQRMIGLVRNYSGYREYPKYVMVNHYFVYKQALLQEAERLVEAGILRETTDLFYLTFEELRAVVRTQTIDHALIDARKTAYRWYEKLTPPRVLTSEGEIVTGAYKRTDLPVGALAGLAVSSGSIEGRARVLHTMEEADLEPGDILVTAFTDPSWTPLFVSIKGLVTEVGGLMTHGAVIAREYGLPAVVGVENATQLIQDGQRIRVNGTAGFVEIID